jgi:heme/copper-type cytochrome/quinol oxidase subunit 2
MALGHGDDCHILFNAISHDIIKVKKQGVPLGMPCFFTLIRSVALLLFLNNRQVFHEGEHMINQGQVGGGEPMRFYVIKKQYLFLGFILFIAAAAAAFWVMERPDVTPASTSDSGKTPREIHLVTGEFKTVTDSGEEIESYRWDPGVIFLEKGEKVNLKIYGINGMEHPFSIEGTDIKGTVKKGEETLVPLELKEEGVYRLICLVHHDKNNNGPMIAYIVVD